MDRARLAVESLAAEQENLLTSCQVWKWKVSFDKTLIIWMIHLNVGRSSISASNLIKVVGTLNLWSNSRPCLSKKALNCSVEKTSSNPIEKKLAKKKFWHQNFSSCFQALKTISFMYIISVYQENMCPTNSQIWSAKGSEAEYLVIRY